MYCLEAVDNAGYRLDVTIDTAVAPKVLARGQDAAAHRDNPHQSGLEQATCGGLRLRVCQSATPGQPVPLTVGLRLGKTRVTRDADLGRTA